MNLIDWAIIAFAVLLVPIGWQAGLSIAGLTLFGFAAGIFAGSRLAPLVLEGGAESPYLPVASLLLGLMIGVALSTLLADLGRALRLRLLRRPASGAIDTLGGAALMAVLALAVSWVLGAVALNAPALRDFRDDVQRSTILTALNRTLPPSGPLLNVLNRIDRTPQLRGPNADVGPPDRGILGAPGVDQAAGSVVRVVGTACGLGTTGSGWVAQPGEVVTNAHVVAGQRDTRVITPAGTEHDAFAVHYEPRNDVAVLRVQGLDLPPLQLADQLARGTPGVSIGFPAGEPARRPARLGTSGQVQSQDSYGRGPLTRQMTSFRGRVEGGNSGGPVVNVEGQVLTTVFAAGLGSGPPEGLGVPNGIVDRILGQTDGQVGTGPCAA